MDRIDPKLPRALLPWFDKYKRDLPWRADTEPYHIWLSEIMLQQTRVEAVKGYYSRFLQALPDVASLAEAPDDLLLKLWEGLGYYSRVRNLKKAARIVMEQYGGQFPGEYEAVLALPGIGEYTAGAICSIAFGLPTPAVDGNVLRVVSRLAADFSPVDSPVYKKQVQQALRAVYPARAGDFTQALMELGATICGPNREPDCEKCPCSSFCRGYAQNVASLLPVKLPKKGRRQEEKTVLILCCDGHFALQKRPEKGLLAGLWQFPELPGKLEAGVLTQTLSPMGIQVREIYRQTEKIHIFTHIQWEMRGFYVDVAEKTPEFTWLTPEEIDRTAALPTAYRQFWEDRI